MVEPWSLIPKLKRLRKLRSVTNETAFARFHLNSHTKGIG